MADAAYERLRLAAVYDALNPDRSDLDVFAALVDELGARTVLDIGCGTGTLALLLAARGVDVTAVDPAAGMLVAAQAKPGAEDVTWLRGTAAELPALQVDLAVMTGNVAQAIVDPDAWAATLRGAHAAVRPGGQLLLDTRDPAARQWLRWNREESWRRTAVPGVGAVETWHDVVDVRWPLVTLRETFVFDSERTVLTSESTLRFRRLDEVQADLEEHGWAVHEVRDGGGDELLLLAQRRSR